MTEVETRWFVLLDSYARSRNKCFLAEFFREQSTQGCMLCFRPLVSLDSVRRYACEYLRIDSEALKATASSRELALPLATTVDSFLDGLADGQ